MVALLIIFIVLVIGCIIRYTFFNDDENDSEAENSVVVSKPLSQCTVAELKDLLRRKNIEIEMQKNKYQSCLTNPYCWPVTRDLVKSTLEAMFNNKLNIEDELAKRELDMSLNDQAIDKKS